MGQVVVSLAEFRRPSGDWSNQEIAEFWRVEHVLASAGLRLETDRGLTDEGEPWFVFVHQDSGEVFAHFARIGRTYVLASSSIDGAQKGTSVRDVVDRFMQRCNALNPPARPRVMRKLFMHPAASLAAILVTLYFLTESSHANAATLDEGSHDSHADRGGGMGGHSALRYFAELFAPSPRADRGDFNIDRSFERNMARQTAVAYETEGPFSAAVTLVSTLVGRGIWSLSSANDERASEDAHHGAASAGNLLASAAIDGVHGPVGHAHVVVDSEHVAHVGPVVAEMGHHDSGEGTISHFQQTATVISALPVFYAPIAATPYAESFLAAAGANSHWQANSGEVHAQAHAADTGAVTSHGATVVQEGPGTMPGAPEFIGTAALVQDLTPLLDHETVATGTLVVNDVSGNVSSELGFSFSLQVDLTTDQTTVSVIESIVQSLAFQWSEPLPENGGAPVTTADVQQAGDVTPPPQSVVADLSPAEPAPVDGVVPDVLAAPPSDVAAQVPQPADQPAPADVAALPVIDQASTTTDNGAGQPPATDATGPTTDAGAADLSPAPEGTGASVQPEPSVVAPSTLDQGVAAGSAGQLAAQHPGASTPEPATTVVTPATASTLVHKIALAFGDEDSSIGDLGFCKLSGSNDDLQEVLKDFLTVAHDVHQFNSHGNLYLFETAVASGSTNDVRIQEIDLDSGHSVFLLGMKSTFVDFAHIFG